MPVLQVDGARMRECGLAQDPRRQQLVARCHERLRPVEEAGTTGGKPVESPEPLLDAVELVADVKPDEHDVSAHKGEERLARRHQLGGDAIPATGGEGHIRGARPVADDREAHRHPKRGAGRHGRGTRSGYGAVTKLRAELEAP
jgi:hypothetical protein